jgi:hypothetical protein
MISTPLWPETTCTRCVARRGAISRNMRWRLIRPHLCGRRPSPSRSKGGDMQFSLKAMLLLVTLTFGSASYGFDFCGLAGIGSVPCGCGNGNCCDGCEPNRWIDGGCGCEAGCGCEPSCGCSSNCCEPCGCGSYCADGRSFAGQSYNCGCESYMPTCGCTGPSCCEPACGCASGCCDDGCCGCEPSCGCSSGCEPSCGCASGGASGGGCCTGLFRACRRMCSGFYGGLCGGSCGCSGETYWSEWHNDPPCCCDPCNRCGQWTGPSAGCGCGCGGCGSGNCGCNGGYSGPYNGPDGGPYGGDGYYSSHRPTRPNINNSSNSYATNQPPRKPVNTSMSRATTGYSPNVARNTSNPYTRSRLAREAQPILTQPPQSRR